MRVTDAQWRDASQGKLRSCFWTWLNELIAWWDLRWGAQENKNNIQGMASRRCKLAALTQLKQHPALPSQAARVSLISLMPFVLIRRALQVPLLQTGELHQHVPPGGQRHAVRGRPGHDLRADLHQQRRRWPTGNQIYFSTDPVLWRNSICWASDNPSCCQFKQTAPLFYVGASSNTTFSVVDLLEVLLGHKTWEWVQGAKGWKW